MSVNWNQTHKQRKSLEKNAKRNKNIKKYSNKI